MSHYHYEDKFKDRMGAPGEIAAKKAAEECVAISRMMGRGCPAPVIWKVQHLSQGLSGGQPVQPGGHVLRGLTEFVPPNELKKRLLF